MKYTHKCLYKIANKIGSLNVTFGVSSWIVCSMNI